jgi:hypothetical protein
MTRRGSTSSRRHSVTPSLLLLALLTACAPEERVTQYKPFFTGIAGAEFAGQEPVRPSGDRRDPLSPGDVKTVIEHEDGTKTYLARVPLHLMAHVENLLDENSDEADAALLEQLVDIRTKEHYRSQGKDPAEFVRGLHRRRKDIAKLFARMPMAENSPTVLVEQPGDRMWVIRLTGQAAEDTRLRELWVRFDLGQWRLVNVR